MKKIIISIAFLSLFCFVSVAYAQNTPVLNTYSPNTPILNTPSCSNLTTFASVVSCAMSIINSVIPVIVAITVLWIIWGAFNLTKSEGEDRNKWRDVILYGIVGLFVMVSIYGFVNLLSGTFSFGGNNTINVPNISNSIKAQ